MPTNCGLHQQLQPCTMWPTPNQWWLLSSSVSWAPSSPSPPFFNTRTRRYVAIGNVETKRWWWMMSFSSSTHINDLQPQAWAFISLLLHFLTSIPGAPLLMAMWWPSNNNGYCLSQCPLPSHRCWPSATIVSTHNPSPSLIFNPRTRCHMTRTPTSISRVLPKKLNEGDT